MKRKVKSPSRSGSEPKDARHYEPENMPWKTGVDRNGVAKNRINDMRIGNYVEPKEWTKTPPPRRNK